MIVDWRADHSLRIPRPDLTLEIGTPNACTAAGCHEDETDQWAADDYVERIVAPAIAYGFPMWYIERLESFRP